MDILNKELLELVKDLGIAPLDKVEKINNLINAGADVTEAFKYCIITQDKYLVNQFLKKPFNVNANRGILLNTAVLSEEFDLVKALVKKGANLNPLGDGLRPLYASLSVDKKDLVKFLLDKGAIPLPTDIDFAKSVDVLKMLLEKMPKINKKNSSYLKYATLLNQFDKVEHLLKNGFVQDSDAVDNAIDFKNEKIISLLMENGGEISPSSLIKLQIFEYRAILKMLIDQEKVDVSKCLNIAIASGDASQTKFLLENSDTKFQNKTLLDVLDNGDLKSYLESLLKKDSKDEEEKEDEKIYQKNKRKNKLHT